LSTDNQLTAILETGWPSVLLYPTLAHRRSIFTADMTTYYCHTLEEALKRAKAAGKSLVAILVG